LELMRLLVISNCEACNELVFVDARFDRTGFLC